MSAIDAPWFLVCEERARWSPALRTELLGASPDAAARVVTREEIPHPEEFLATAEPVCLALTITPQDLQARLALLSRLRENPLVCPVGLLGFSGHLGGVAAEAELALLEAGAVATFASPQQIEPLVALAKRHAERAWRWLALQYSPHEIVWRRLPWQQPAWAIGWD